MVSVWARVVLAGAVGNGSAFDPKAYIQSLPSEVDSVDDDENGDDDAKAPPRKVPATEPASTIQRAEVTVEGKQLLALRSSFGTIYLAKSGRINARTLAAATCAKAKPAPTAVTPDQPLDQADQAQEAAIIKVIESRCKP